MTTTVDFWRIAAGLGLFLYGMLQLERALQQLAGRPFKQFLRDRTSRPLQGVLAGTVATAALQSSSVVGLIVLAFVGAGVISLGSALGIVFGSNLGTTATGWIVATIGFKLDIEAIALPVVAIGALAVVWSPRQTRVFRAGQLMIGFGLLLLGLDYMKAGASDAAALFDPDALRDYPAIVFLGAGILVTALIQSSSATITITLSAIYAGAIPLQQAAAVAIGADLGTTVTIILGALAGSAAKKRVAAALVLFNAVTDTVAFVFLVPLLALIENGLGITDPLYALVAFHSLFNLIGVLAFLPLTGLLSRRLEGMFEATGNEAIYLASGDTTVPDIAIENLRLETRRLVDQACALNQLGFGLRPEVSFYDSAADRQSVDLFSPAADYDAGYASIKRLEAGITEFALELERQPLGADESAQLRQIFGAVRAAVHSAKNIRDVRHDLESFRNSVNDGYFGYLERFREAAAEYYRRLDRLRSADDASHRFEILLDAHGENERRHRDIHQHVYEQVREDALADVEISTVLNVNRELYSANLGILYAIADVLLDPARAEDVRAVPSTR